MRIYIIGPSGSGKTTLSKKLAEKYDTNCYELDCLVYDDNNNHIKRTDKEIEELFKDILKKKSWIIEDVGRKKFSKGLEYSDKIYYLKIPKLVVYYRVIKRWIRQRFGKENYNYPPTMFQFYDMLKTAKGYYKKENEKLERIKKYKNKVTYLTRKDINNLL